MTLPVTLYASAHTTTPMRVDHFDSWQEFAREFPELVNVEAPSKAACFYFAPYAMPEGATRADANVSELSLLVTDLDALPEGGPDGIVECLRAAGVAGLVYESPSSTDLNPRLRIVSPVTEAIPADKCAHTRLAFAEALGLEPGCGADGVPPASIGFYVGRVAGTRERRVWHVDGAPANTAGLIAWPLAHAWKKGGTKRDAPARDVDRAPIEVQHTTRVLELAALLEARWLGGDREAGNFEKSFYGWLLARGWSRGEVVGLVEALDSNEPLHSRRVEHARKARTAAPLSGVAEVVRAWMGDAWAEVDAHVNAAGREWSVRVMARREREKEAAQQERLATRDTLFGRRYFFADAEEPIVYICQGLALAVSDGKVSMIAGSPGGAKGPLADHVTACIALGSPVFGVHATTRARVLLLDAEGRRLTMKRLRRMVRAMGLDPRELDEWLHLFDASRHDLADPSVQGEIQEYCAAHDVGAVVLDSYTSAMLASGVEANQPKFAQLAKALGALDLLVLCVAHTNKAAGKGEPSLLDIAYSGAFAAMAQTAIVVSYPDGRDKHLVRVSCARAPEHAFAPMHVKFTDTADGGLGVAVVREAAAVEARREPRATAGALDRERETRDAMRRILEHARKGSDGASSSARELIAIAGEGRAAGERALARLVENASLARVAGVYRVK
jgi:hypothetical protein